MATTSREGPTAGGSRAGSWTVPDWYVVVDELEDDHARLTVDPWPDVDAVGRLAFVQGVETETVTVEPSEFHELVARERLAAASGDEEAARRALRIGDAFAVWGDHGIRDEGHRHPRITADHVVTAVHVVDVTASARLVTHAAVEAAAAGMVAPQVAQVLERGDPDDEPTEEQVDDLPGPFPTP